MNDMKRPGMPSSRLDVFVLIFLLLSPLLFFLLFQYGADYVKHSESAQEFIDTLLMILFL